MMRELSLVSLIKASGFKMEFLAEELGLTRRTFSNKVHGWSRFTDEEIEALSRLLDMNPRVIRRALPERRY